MPTWRRGLALRARHNLLFELQVFADQMRHGAALAPAFPDMVFVLAHAGMLEDMSEDGWKRWREGMSALAEQPNVNVKLSGLGTFVHACRATSWRRSFARRSRYSVRTAVSGGRLQRRSRDRRGDAVAGARLRSRPSMRRASARKLCTTIDISSLR